METRSHPPRRRVSHVVLVVLASVFSLLALVLPIVAVQKEFGGPVHFVVLAAFPIAEPITRGSEAVVLVGILALIAALIVAPVLLIRAVVRRRSGRVARSVVVVAALLALFWGFFFAVGAVGTGLGLLPGPWAMLLAAILLLVAQGVVLPSVRPALDPGA